MDGKKIKYFYFIEFGEINEVAIYKDNEIQKKDYYFIMYCGVRIKTDKKHVIFNYYEAIKKTKKRLKFVHLSRDLRVMDKFKPRLPLNYLDSEPMDIKRVCVARNISDAYTGLKQIDNDIKDYCGYIPLIKYEIIPDELGIKLENIVSPKETAKYVEDAEYSKEWWILEEFEVPRDKISGIQIIDYDITTHNYGKEELFAIDCFNVTNYSQMNVCDLYAMIETEINNILKCSNDITMSYCIIAELFNRHCYARNMKVEKTMSLKNDELQAEINEVLRELKLLTYFSERILKFNKAS